MTPFDLVFLASVLFVLILSISIAISALRGRFDAARRRAKLLGWFAGCYAVVLISVSLARPRRFYDAGELRCFDDWCVTAISARSVGPAPEFPCQTEPGSPNWVAVLKVSSVAKRIRQRARDARAELEDQQGRRYQPCAPPIGMRSGLPRSLSDELGPGESFQLTLPFRLPHGATPSGLIVHHGEFPGIVIIGADQSFLHPPALMRLTLGLF